MRVLQLHTSNRLELLARRLSDDLAAATGDPFASRHVLCQSNALGRWLKHRFCARHGVVLLLETELPAAWLWRTAAEELGQQPGYDPLSRERMQWLINEELANSSSFWSAPGVAELTQYLHNDDTGLRRWQLAGRIADVFDRYQYYRPQLIREWSGTRTGSAGGGDSSDHGLESTWQTELWRRLLRRTSWHRVALRDAFVATLEEGRALDRLPSRLDLFAINSLPPLLLEAFLALGRHLPVHLWLLSPTEQYWADLVTRREFARRSIEDPELVTYWQKGNPLLTQWGPQAQVLQDLLINHEEYLSDVGERFDEPTRDSLLGNVQADIFDAVVAAKEDPAPATIPNEGPLPSIQVHVCHGPMRECQVLHDTLLHCLNADPALQPEDILVLVPEISRYAPYIEAVFRQSATEGQPSLPFNISDVVVADEHPVIQALLDMLDLPDSRFSRSDVMSLVNIPEVRKHFGLAEEDPAALAELFDELRVYWGLDSADKQRFGLPQIDENTWHQAFRRVMAGFALDGEELYGDIAPLPALAASEAQSAASFFDLLDTLRRWSRALSEPASAGQWSLRLREMVDSVFGSDPDEEGRLDHIRETLDELAEAGADSRAELELPVVRYWLRERLSAEAARGHFFSGGVTFCAMRPLRGVPFKIICLLGMQDRAFPRRRTAIEFDLMAEHWRRGDPAPVLEDRYLFLETVLAARQKLIISYTGRHERTNEALEPSVLVSELMEYLDSSYLIEGQKPGKVLEQVHPLQPFGRGNFTAEGNRSFDRWWLGTARAIVTHEAPQPIPGWPDLVVELPEGSETTVSPGALGSFFRNPIRRFMQQRLRVHEPREVELVEEEPFDLGGLELWQIRKAMLDQALRDEGAEPAAVLRARGLLPHGTPGLHTVSNIEQEISAITQHLPQPPPLHRTPIDVELEVVPPSGNSWRIVGRLHRCYADTGLLELSPSKYCAVDVLSLWIEHLCACAAGSAPGGESLFVARDKACRLAPVADGEALELLAGLVSVFEAGQVSPLPFSRKASSAWIEKWSKSGDEAAALKSARSAWRSRPGYPGDGGDFYVQLLLRGREWEPDEAFAAVAKAVLEPMQQHMEALS